MMVTFVSQCEKKSLNKTRRVLDAFANRIGNRTWQTVITNEGLIAVKKLLRKTASKNTAVSCHWIRSRSRSEFLWVVGNKDKFNAEGIVPVNYTEKDIPMIEQFNLNSQVIALLSGLAGLFHDVGKATTLFQKKLDGSTQTKGYEAYRHEWVSLRIFQAFVNNNNDKEWLERLVNIDNQAESEMLAHLEALKDGIAKSPINPFKTLPPIAKLVAWLIVSHHKLPQYPKNEDNSPNLDDITTWLEDIFEPCWNTPQCLADDWTRKDIEKNWTFPAGTPLKSAIWQTQASELAKKVIQHNRMFLQSWFDQRYTAHISRLCLMLADHYYSSGVKIKPKWQDRNYHAYANTYDDNGHKQLKQKLDEHNIVVGKSAYDIAKELPNLRSQLPSLKPNKALTARVSADFHEDYGWQDKAFSLAKAIKDNTKKYGFFGVCLASTGKGKTRANARIMYGLSEEGKCRFSIALGLRTLTLQTGDALDKDLKLKNDMAVLIGSQAVKDLHAQSKIPETSEEEQHGSGSAESLFKDQMALIENLPEMKGKFSKWLKHDPRILKLIQAPVLVSTIDYLMPATEGIRGGRQIAPILRLLTSDLVLDEPDDFGLEDFPALCRLVNWAGMLGSRVLLSTATLSPSLASTLFEAYQDGRRHHTAVNGELGISSKICCAWFDEFKKPQDEMIDNTKSYEAKHSDFIEKRIKNLAKKALPLRQPKLIPIQKESEKTTNVSSKMASVIRSSIEELHQNHSIKIDKKKVSIGLVRMANITQLVQIAKNLLLEDAPDDTVIHYCIYHSQFTLLQRSSIEKQLDNALTRKDEKEWLKHSGIPELTAKHKEKNHIFVVLATPVAEVGRDHDYDWAVVEPSSMRSIIQLAGRIQRHRKLIPASENIHILSKNYKGLEGKEPCFIKPGFETDTLRYSSRELSELIEREEFKEINAIPRIKTPSDYGFTTDKPPRFESFNGLEHLAQIIRLVGSPKNQNHAALWWRNQVTWCGELQRIQPFRKSEPSDDFRLILTRTEKLRWQKKVAKTYPVEYVPTDDIENQPENIKPSYGNVFWSQFDLQKEVSNMAAKTKESEEVILKRFTHLSLRRLDEDSEIKWQDHPVLGVYQILKNDEYEND